MICEWFELGRTSSSASLSISIGGFNPQTRFATDFFLRYKRKPAGITGWLLEIRIGYGVFIVYPTKHGYRGRPLPGG